MYLRQLCLKSNTLQLKPAGRREQSACCKREMDGILLNIIVSVDDSEKHGIQLDNTRGLLSNLSQGFAPDKK